MKQLTPGITSRLIRGILSFLFYLRLITRFHSHVPDISEPYLNNKDEQKMFNGLAEKFNK
jgi:hypothetical protein